MFSFYKTLPTHVDNSEFVVGFSVSAFGQGRAIQFSKITDYFRSYTDPEMSDVTKSIVQGITHRQILDNGVLTNILAVSADAVDIRPYRALSAGIGTESLVSLARRHKALAAINGGFFEMSGTFRGESVGALKIDGEWVSEPEQGRAVIGFRTVDGKIETYIDRIALRQETRLAERRGRWQLMV